MSATVMGCYSPESQRELSPDTMSPVYPDRPIRPLPKRRLRERLSPDIADSIKYPPTPKTTAPLFYYPYSVGEEQINGTITESQHPSERERADEIERNYISRRNGDEIDSDDDDLPYQSRIYARHSPDTSGRSYRYVQKPDSSRYSKSQPPPSTASSADGYDSFENTNNKKKRKIPTPGDSGTNGSHLANDLASMGLSRSDDTSRDDGSASGQFYSSGSSAMTNAQSLSGPGRGRYGRVRNSRSPLRTLDASSNWGNGRSPKQRPSQWPSSENTGIISAAIANAEKLPALPRGLEGSFSLIHQQASKKTDPPAQFTFTCNSQVFHAVPSAPSISWSAIEAANPNLLSSLNRSRNSHVIQTSPNMAQSRDTRQNVSQQTQGATKNNTQPAPSKKTRRRTGQEYLIAARQRRQQQAYQNYHHPPSQEDIWICEFCEYESIFGTPPLALIKQYEIKDRRERRKQAEKRRLLEKAKMKGRKGKKGIKTASKNSAQSNARQDQYSNQAPPMNHSQSQSQGTQSEEYYEDEYEGEYAADGGSPISPVDPIDCKFGTSVGADPRRLPPVHGNIEDDGDPAT